MESQLARIYCEMFSTGLSSGSREGNRIGVMFVGMMGLLVACHAARSMMRIAYAPLATLRAISSICACMASVFTRGDAIAAPLRAPDKSLRTDRCFRNAGRQAGEVASRFSPIDGRFRSFCRSWLHPGTRVQSALSPARPQDARLTRARSFLNASTISPCCAGCLGRALTWEKPSFFHKGNDVSLAIVKAEALFDDPLKINPPPANDAIFLAVRSCLHDSSQVRKLGSTQPWFNAPCMRVTQTVRLLVIKTANPVAKVLAIDPSHPGAVSLVHAVQNAAIDMRRRLWLLFLVFLARLRRAAGE